MRIQSALGLVLTCVLTGCTAASGSESVSLPTSSAIASPTSNATSTPTTTPSATAPPTLATDSFAEVVTTDLVVRSAPGTGHDSDIFGKVANLPVIVLDGPVQADGYEWWLIAPLAERFEPPPSGWVAAGGQGEVWLSPTSPSCEELPTSDALWDMPSAMWVGCYSRVELTLRGTLWRCSELADGIGFVSSGCALRNCTPDVCETLVDDRAVQVHLDPLPPIGAIGKRIRVTGHFDDLAAELCAVHGSPLSALQVFWCRAHFVATSYAFRD